MKLGILCTSYLPEGKSHWKRTLETTEIIDFGQYGNVVSPLSQSPDSDALLIVIFALDFQGVDSFKAYFEDFISSLRDDLGKTSTPIIIALSTYIPLSTVTTAQNVSPKSLVSAQASKAVYDVISKHKNLYFLDLDAALSEIGFQKAFDERNWYFAHLRLSSDGLRILDRATSEILDRIFNASKKVLVLDCDNTLWGGVVGEAGLQGLELGTDGIGTAFKDFQREIKNLTDAGVILTLSSKNIEQDVKDVFDNHPSMELGWDDVVSPKVNWDEKAKNIVEISNELGLALNSFVFWDDNPIEREKVKTALPDVTVIDVPEAVIEWPKLVATLNEFAKFNVTNEDRKKNHQYKIRKNFLDEASRATVNHSNFLKTINLVPNFSPVPEALIGRAVQMTQKTTQFNFRSKRYTEIEITKKINSPESHVWICAAADKYGDHGNIGLAIIDKMDKEKAFLDTFLFSCRVLGRDLEKWFMQKLLDELYANGISTLLIEYRKTDRNEIAKQFLRSLAKLIKPAPDEILTEINPTKDSDFFVISTSLQFVDTQRMYSNAS